MSKHKVVMSQTDPTEMSADALVVDYAKNKKFIDTSTARLKVLRQPLIDVLDTIGLYDHDGCSVSLSKKTKTVVNEEAVDKLAKKKGVDLGEVYYEIIPKKAVPEKVLKALDEYFTLMTIREITPKMLEKAVGHKHITKGEMNKCLTKTPTPALMAKVDKDVANKIIEYYD